MRLVLFDIDGTLVRANGAGRAAMRHALELAFGTAGAIDTYHFGGSCDRYTIFHLMGDAGFAQTDIEAVFSTLGEHMAAYLLRNGDTYDIGALPGGRALYHAVAEHDTLILGVVTGNFEESGRAKLRLAGYEDRAIVTGAYGSESENRADLPRLALHRIQTLTGVDIPPEHVTVIGDTTSDIACARASGARVISVCTGSDDEATLRAAEPDLVVQGLNNTSMVLDFLLA